MPGYRSLLERLETVDRLTGAIDDGAGDDFLAWLETVSPEWFWRWRHLDMIRRHLHRVTAGECRKLMIFCPPRHGKTEHTTVRYPVWRLERDPKIRVIMGAYNQTLADKFSRKARRIAKARLSLSDERKAVSDWETAAGGGVRAVGVGAGIAGHGANLVMIDDPVKSREEAESQTYRDKVYEWYTDDLFTRLEPGGAAVLIMTRWHDDDLSGRILRSEDGPNWEVLSMPAEAEAEDVLGRRPGEALCPERFDLEALASIKRVLGLSYFALYQQRPVPREGAFFLRQNLRYWYPHGDYYRLVRGNGMPEATIARTACKFLITADTAGSEKERANYTVVQAWALTPDHDMVLVDMDRGQWEVDKVPSAVQAMYAKWSPYYLGVECKGPSGLHTVQKLRKLGLPVKALEPGKDSKDSYVRIGALQSRVEIGKVFLPRSAPWLRDVENELLNFPSAANDDIVDAAAYAAREVERLVMEQAKKLPGPIYRAVGGMGR